MNVAIIGGSGYAGGELLRLLLQHPDTQITTVTSNRFTGEYLYTTHPNLRGHTTIKYSPLDVEKITEENDAVFMATPHGVSHSIAPRMLESGVRIIDLSADFRLKDPADYPKWYGWEHSHPEKLAESVYGVPELHREEIKRSRFVACGGCMSTASLLALAPAVENGLIDTGHIIIDAKIGSSGGGSKPTPANHHTERFGAVRPYMVVGHRHIAEIEQELKALTNEEIRVGFTPHTLNMARGILVTAHLWASKPLSDRDVWKAYRGSYNDEPFIRFVKSKKGLHQLPDPKNVTGTNHCDIGFEVDTHVDRLVVFSAIDNIVKGAAGQAVQCYNLMTGRDERAGLNLIGYH